MAGGGEVFGQHVPPLHVYLKDVLENYPEGGQILKELVQNSDDAEAKKVVFLYDKSVHPHEKLLHETLKDFQGPALYAYNDAKFKETDWFNIQHPQQSQKKEDVVKVGRFGLGFISVYHLTDMPCILSDNRIAFLDPLEHFGSRQYGRSWDLNNSLLDNCPDQFSPYISQVFECDKTSLATGKFKGTIFKLPLRMKKSEISESVFDSDSRIRELFESFQRDAEISLLFLKHVESISVYERETVHEQPRPIFQVKIHYEKRRDLATFLSKIQDKNDAYNVHLACTKFQQAEQPVVETKYLTLNSLKFKNTSVELQKLITDRELKLLPWMGMSLRIGSSSVEPNTEEQAGRVFCFLPLPVKEKTGVPVHIHGYFGLDNNRRGIKWPDHDAQNDKKALWNQLLSTEVFPGVYKKLILSAVDESIKAPDRMQPADVYKGWPRVENVDSKWARGVREFLQLMKDEAVFYTDHCNGSWMTRDDVFVAPQNGPLIAKVLTHKNCPLAQVPGHVIESFKWAGIPYKEVSPALVRRYIQGDPLQFLTRDEKLDLLEYVSSDTLADLDNLRLLPLKNDEFTSFSQRAAPVYIATSENPSVLIPNGDVKFAASDLPAVLASSEMYQLRVFRQEHVALLLRDMLPSDWRSGTARTLPWTPGSNHHPPREWLTEIWNWLTRNRDHLLKFYGLPLIPMDQNCNRIARLQAKKMMYCNDQENPEMLGICSFLEDVGVTVVRHSLPSSIADHPDLRTFIRPSSPEGVMDVLEAVSKEVTLHEKLKQMNSQGKDHLRRLLAEIRQPTSEQQNILKALPFFLAIDEKYISAKDCVAAVPSDYFGIPVTKVLRSTRLILLRDTDSSDRFALSLGVHEKSVKELLKDNYLPAVADGLYNEFDSLKIMTWVLRRQEFDALVKNLKFLPICFPEANTKVTRLSPSELFEPTQTIQLLFGDKKVFPTGEYSHGSLLGFLRRVGLKKESDITAADLLMCGVEISQTQVQGNADVERGAALLKHVSCYPELLHHIVTKDHINKTLHKFLKDLCWIPCQAVPPENYPLSSDDWAGQSQTLYKQKEVGLIESALLQGSVLPLIDLTSPQMMNLFCWSKTLDPKNYYNVERVVQHLKNVASKFQNTQKTYLVSRTVSEIYAFLNEASDEHIQDCFDVHKDAMQHWVWYGSGFATPNDVALSVGKLGVSLVPYLHVVSDDVKKYEGFLAKRGVQQTFPENALCKVLLKVQDKHTTRVCSEDDHERDLNLVCNILRYIVSLDGSDTQNANILVPCRPGKSRGKRLVMTSARECLYVDEERLVKQLSEFDKFVIHEAISNDVAQKLGLQPLSHCIAPSDSVGYEVTGPHETTVNAIKHNLNMIKEGVDIFKELIQNADDAKAKEVKFLLDWRRNEETAKDLLSEGMKMCHGPALWAYNDAIFSEEDIKNICNIASQSKREQQDKVGRFGLGFTSVYHITDVPSVISGHFVLICDPGTNHLGSRVKPEQPGIKLDLRNPDHQRTLKSYPNQFAPYNGLFGCNLKTENKYDHTLFRLPLRTLKESTGHNQLSDSVYDSKEKFEHMIDTLKKAAPTLLLFTQNVVHVNFYELESGGSVNDVKKLMSVRLSRVAQMPRSISISASDMSTERNILKATQAYMNDNSLPIPETTMVVKVTQETHASVRGKIKLSKKDFSFIISSCMATDQHMLELACKERILPCGGVAVQLVPGGQGLTPDGSNEGKAFSFLPLSVSTRLPFHVNGNFLLQPNRRQLWSKTSSGKEEFEVRWNICVMKLVLCQALLNLLQDLADLQDQKFPSEIIVDARDFQSLWPRRSCESDFYPLVDDFYCKIGSETDAPPVIYNQSQWVSVHDCFFTDWNPNDPLTLRDTVRALLTQHQNVPMRHGTSKRCVELHTDVVRSIHEAGAQKSFVDNTFSIDRFLRDIFFPMLREDEGYSEPKLYNEVLLHVLDLRLGERKVNEYDEILKVTNCIPTSPEGEELASPRELVNPYTEIGSLYNKDDCRFPHGEEYLNKARLLSLTELGMASDDLSWDDICERAESLPKADQKSKTLWKLINEKLRKDNPTPDQKKRIQEAAFLPVLSMPESFPTEWYHSDSDFMAADELYDSSHKYLLGSVKPLLDEERLGSNIFSQGVKTFLGIHEREVSVHDVLQQLHILIHEEQPEDIRQAQTMMVHGIYSFLQTKLCTGSGHKPEVQEQYRADVDKLSTWRFVLCGTQFKECKQLAFQYKGKCGPYLYQVPLTQFTNLLTICGVRDDFEVEDFLNTLEHLKSVYQDKPLEEEDLATAKAMVAEIVSRLAKIPSEDERLRKRSSLEDTVFVPDNHGILHTPSEQTFNDMPWETSHENVVYTHQGITYDGAKALGIITAREKQLESFSSIRGFEREFGQTEELTVRLNSILRSYPVADVFKELLQNADDAGSTEIHFVYDPRSHPTEKVVSDSWKALQQHSLCVYNNKPFTEADIKGIQKVGVGGKRDDIATTGKFGIGFNAVYHLTDCPSFLSNGDTLCVFDPLLKFIPGTQKTSPGRMFEAGEEFREKFPDMLRGYLVDVLDLNIKEGTMFRFPLRAEQSDISKEVFSRYRIKGLLDDFKKASQEGLLFLNNINRITISSVNERTNKLEMQYSISAKLSPEGQKCRMQLMECLESHKVNPYDETHKPMPQVYSLGTEDSEKTEKLWLISQMLGIEDALSSMGDSGFKKPLPRGGVAALIKDSNFGMPPQQRYSAYCLLPLPVHTNLPVHVNGAFELDDTRKYLVKGDAFAGTERNAEERGLIHRWNRILVENVIAPAYARLLEHAGRELLESMDESQMTFADRKQLYDELFPQNIENLRDEWQLLAKATLNFIDKCNLKVLPVVRSEDNRTISWHHPKSDDSRAFFDDLNLLDGSNMGEKQKANSILLRRFLLDVGFNLLAASRAICKAFQVCEVGAKFVTPQVVVEYFASGAEVASSLPASLKETTFKDMQTFRVLFKYCLEGITHPACLNGLPIRLTNDDMVSEFRTTDELYVTPHCNVLPCVKERFLHKKLVGDCMDCFKKNKTSDEAYTSGVFKQFTIFELAQHLGKQLPEDWQDCDRHVEWTPGINGQPSQEWLRKLWKFICSVETADEDKEPQSLEAINSWPIFPTTCGKLAPPSLSKKVLFLHSFCDSENRKKIAHALRKLGLPEISWERICQQKKRIGGHEVLQEPPGLKQLLRQHLALPTAQEEVTNVIDFVLQTEGKVGGLSLAESDTLLQYFQEADPILSEKGIKTLRQLPVFVLQGQEHSKTTDLKDYQCYHTIESDQLLKVEAQTWKNHFRCVLLRPRPVFSLIYEQLGITPITLANLYLEYIIPSFGLLSNEAKEQHIKFICELNRHASKEEMEAFQRRLSCIPFIPDENECLQTASCFFNPHNTVFKAFVDKSQWLPEFLHIYSWGFLKQIGLHVEVSTDDFIRFADEVQSRAIQVGDCQDELKDLFEISKLLTKELRENRNLRESHFLQKVAEIKFIPSVPVKQDLLIICPAFLASDSPNLVPYIAYRGSVPERHPVCLELVWSVCMLLPHWAIPSNDKVTKNVSVHDCLGIETKAVTSKVLSHAQNICGQMEQKNAFDKEDTLSTKVRGKVADVMKKMLKYLKHTCHQEHQEAEVERRLRYTAICMVDEGRVFVRADQIVVNMDGDDLRPYLFKAPRELAEFDGVLKLLGAEDRCTIDQLAGVLSAMRKNCGPQHLIPNEKKVAVHAVQLIFKLLLQSKGQCKMSVEELYFPSSEYILTKTSDLYYADPDLMGQRRLVSTDKTFILPLKQCGYEVKDEMLLIQLLPEKLRPKNLGEEMVEKPCDTNKDCPAGEHCEYLQHIKQMVSSEEMTRVLLRLARHQSQRNELDKKIRGYIKALQKHTVFVCKRELKLGYYNNEGEMVMEQNIPRKAFLEKSAKKMHLEHMWPLEKHMSVTFSQIAKCCNLRMRECLDSVHQSHLQTALDRSSPNEMNMALTQLSIPEYDTTTQAVQPDEHRPGTVVPLDIRHLCNPDPYNRFQKDEIVGYERSIDDRNEGVLLPVDDSDALGTAQPLTLMSESSSSNCEIIYAKIVERMDRDEETSISLSQKYRIDIGLEEPIVVSVTSLYKFLRPSKQPDSTVAIFTGAAQSEATGKDLSDDLPQIKEQIKREVEEVFALPREEKRRSVHRLYLKWHPDKNLGRVELASEAFKYLLQQIKRCDVTEQYRCQYSQWNSDIRRDREEATRYQQKFNQSRSSNRENMSNSDFVPPSFTRETPDPRTARLWFRQAQEHFNTAKQVSLLSPSPSQLIAFQVHQSAETALKAAQYSLNGRPDLDSNDLISLARTVGQQTDGEVLLEIACELTQLNCEFSKPRYPQQKSSQTSGQVYENFTTTDALNFCKDLLKHVQDIIGIRVF